MRLFSRRKEINFEDPRLVGMGPLKTIDEQRSLHNSLSMTHNGLGMGVGDDDDDCPTSLIVATSASIPLQSSSPLSLPVGSLLRVKRSHSFITSRQKPSSPVGNNNVDDIDLYLERHHNKDKEGKQHRLASWSRRVSDTWDSLRRSESSDPLPCNVGRRKTLHFSPDHGSSGSKFAEKMLAARDKFNTLRTSSSITKLATATTAQPGKEPGKGKKVGRVQSLRLLLTKSQSKFGGKGSKEEGDKSNNKVDKGTDTEDLDELTPIYSPVRFHTGEDSYLEDELLLNSISSRRSYYHPTSSSSISHIPGWFDSDLENEGQYGTIDRRRCSFASSSDFGSLSSDAFMMMKATSCDNLASMSHGNKRHTLDGRYFSTSGIGGGSQHGSQHGGLHKATSTDTVSPSSSSPSHNQSTSTSTSTMSKRSSFPYAYIRSKLTALPEEPGHAQPSSLSIQRPKPVEMTGRGTGHPMSFSRRKVLHNSMGDLHSPTLVSKRLPRRSTAEMPEEDEEEESMLMMMSMPYIMRPVSSVRGTPPHRRPCSIACPPGQRMFDPLTQVRIDLLHNSPSEWDTELGVDGHSPLFGRDGWGGGGGGGHPHNLRFPQPRRSFSIGEISRGKENRGSMMGSSTEVSSSGYDSDSTRATAGNDSPRMRAAAAGSASLMKVAQEEIGEESEPSTKSTSSSSSSSSSPSRMVGHHPLPLVFDTDSTLSSVVDSADSSTCCDRPSPSSSSSSSCYGPLAYVTLTRMRKGNGEVSSGFGGRRHSSGSKPSHITLGSVRSSTLPRSQSISCIDVGGPLRSSGLPRKRRKGSVDVDSRRGGASQSQVRTSDEDEDELQILMTGRRGTISSGNRTQVTIPSGTMKPRAASVIPTFRVRSMRGDGDKTRTQSLCLSIFSVKFEKGPTKKSLGFSVVGGKDSPKGSMGIYIKRIFPYGQASEEGNLSEGDEILSVNGQSLSSVTHTEALNIFKGIKSGEVTLQVARREEVEDSGV